MSSAQKSQGPEIQSTHIKKQKQIAERQSVPKGGLHLKGQSIYSEGKKT